MDEKGTLGTDQRMIDFDEDAAPQGKKWECCTACQGRGKVLVDDPDSIARVASVPLSSSVSDVLRRYPSFFIIPHSNRSGTEERRRGNNPFGPRGTLRCLACQRRKKRVCKLGHKNRLNNTSANLSPLTLLV
jgi:hypothetical protein